jgi:hypothetical protein
VLYLLYGTNHDATNILTPYQDYFLLQFNVSANAVTNNYTGLVLNCSGMCRVKASSSMLLIESKSTIRLYPMLPDTTTVNIGSPLLTRVKTWVSSASLIEHQCADIFGSSFAYSDGQYLYFISYSSSTAATASFFFAFPTAHTAVYSIMISAASTLVTVQGASTPLLYIIECTSCVFSYSYTSGSVMPTAMYKTVSMPVSVTYRMRVTRADGSYESGGLTALWTVLDSDFIKSSLAIASQTVTTLATRTYSSDAPGMSTNLKKALIWGSSSTILLEDYSQSTIS